MTRHQRGGPPECERPAPRQEDRPVDRITDVTQHNPLRRRRAAVDALRGWCDPWPREYDEAIPLTERQLDGWQRTADHLLAENLLPAVPVEVARRWWRAGGADRDRAQRVAAGVIR